MPTLFDGLFPSFGRTFFARDAALTLMGMNAIVFLDITSFADELRADLGADSVTRIDSPGNFVPAVLIARQGNRVVFTFEGTKGIAGWWNYVQGAGVEQLGPYPGTVFAPFAQMVRALQPTINAHIAAGDVILFSGHSLGAAIAAILTSLYTQARASVKPTILFAVPRYGDPAFLAAARGTCINVNLPQDPVPLLPPDPVRALQRNPAELRWREAFGVIGGVIPAAQWVFGPEGPQNLDWLVQLAGANIAPSNSPHNTYYYIRSCMAGLPKPYTVEQSTYAALLTRLGLTDPWPS